MDNAPSPFAGVDSYIRSLEAKVESLARDLVGLREKVDLIVTPPENIPLTVPDFEDRYPEFREGLRWKLLHRQTNGLSGAIVEPAVKGGRLRIIPSLFIAWTRERPASQRIDGTPRRPRR